MSHDFFSGQNRARCWASGFWLLSGLLIWWLFWQWPIDAWTIAPFYQAGRAQPFAWREHWALAKLSHHTVKHVVILIGVVLFVAWLASFYRARLQAWRWPAAYVLLAMMFSPSVIGLLKSLSAHACPWNLSAYGGSSIEFALFAPVPEHVGTGKCLPAGHSAGGFSLFAFYFVARQAGLKHAPLYACAALLLGMSMGLAQMMRGAHFLSHNVWSAWITVGVQGGLFMLMNAWANRRGHTLAAAKGMLSGATLSSTTSASNSNS